MKEEFKWGCGHTYGHSVLWVEQQADELVTTGTVRLPHPGMVFPKHTPWPLPLLITMGTVHSLGRDGGKQPCTCGGVLRDHTGVNLIQGSDGRLDHCIFLSLNIITGEVLVLVLKLVKLEATSL